MSVEIVSRTDNGMITAPDSHCRCRSTVCLTESTIRRRPRADVSHITVILWSRPPARGSLSAAAPR